ncbi:4Fe-4S binding protein [Clostridium sp.]|uniref:4Fe-4S binding protein n=1 Tax=Clostridium sp. TaxID=1506 RepID=UPI003D6C748B
MKKNKKIEYLRWSLLGLFVVLVSVAAYLHQVLGGQKAPSIHALCPFGGLESLYTLFTTGGFIGKIFSGTIILFAITLVIAIIFRRSFCGLICPFGAIQEFFGKLGQKIFKKKFIMPAKIDKPLRYLKYVILAITIFYAWKTAGLWMAPYDPWSAYAHLPEGISSVWAESAIGLIILIITVVGSLIYDRFFCKYLCPMGAFYAIVGKFSPYKVVRNENKCIDCGICSKKCPVNIDVQHLSEVKSAECISCQTCVLNCPREGALELKQGKRTISPLVTIIIVMALFFGSIFAFQAAGIYKLTPDALKAGESIKYDEIKGFMTIDEAAEATKTELKDFYIKFKIPENVPKDVKMKEIQNVSPGYNFDAAKESLK